MGGKLAEKENERALRELLTFFFLQNFPVNETAQSFADGVIQLMKENDFAFVTQPQIAKYQWEQSEHLSKAWRDAEAIDRNYAELTNDILETSCESCWDGEESAHQIAVNYVRFLEEQLSRTDRKAHKEGCYYADD